MASTSTTTTSTTILNLRNRKISLTFALMRRGHYISIPLALLLALCGVLQFHHHGTDGSVHLMDSCSASCTPNGVHHHSCGHSSQPGGDDCCCTLQLGAQEPARDVTISHHLTPSHPQLSADTVSAASHIRPVETATRNGVYDRIPILPQPYSSPRPLRAPPAIS